MNELTVAEVLIDGAAGGRRPVVMSEDTEAAGGDVRVLRTRGRKCDAAANTCAPARPCCSRVADSARTISGWPPASAPARSRSGGGCAFEWRRARFVQRYGAVALEPLKDQGSAMLRTLGEADALIAVPPAGVPAVEPIDAIPLAALD